MIIYDIIQHNLEYITQHTFKNHTDTPNLGTENWKKKTFNVSYPKNVTAKKRPSKKPRCQIRWHRQASVGSNPSNWIMKPQGSGWDFTRIILWISTTFLEEFVVHHFKSLFFSSRCCRNHLTKKSITQRKWCVENSGNCQLLLDLPRQVTHDRWWQCTHQSWTQSHSPGMWEEKVLDLAASWSSFKMWNPHLTAKGFTIGSKIWKKIEWNSQKPILFIFWEKISQNFHGKKSH